MFLIYFLSIEKLNREHWGKQPTATFPPDNHRLFSGFPMDFTSKALL